MSASGRQEPRRAFSYRWPPQSPLFSPRKLAVIAATRSLPLINSRSRVASAKASRTPPFSDRYCALSNDGSKLVLGFCRVSVFITRHLREGCLDYFRCGHLQMCRGKFWLVAVFQCQFHGRLRSILQRRVESLRMQCRQKHSIPRHHY